MCDFFFFFQTGLNPGERVREANWIKTNRKYNTKYYTIQNRNKTLKGFGNQQRVHMISGWGGGCKSFKYIEVLIERRHCILLSGTTWYILDILMNLLVMCNFKEISAWYFLANLIELFLMCIEGEKVTFENVKQRGHLFYQLLKHIIKHL